jgi:hypothetical protein
MKKHIISAILFVFWLSLPMAVSAAGQETFLVHLKTSLKQDDAQICVAYNMMLAAQEEGYHVKVLVDAGAINTFKVGWFGKDDIEKYKIPDTLRQALSRQFGMEKNKVPKTYGELLLLIKERGAEFYVNSGYLMVSKIGTPDDPLKKMSQKFFKPVTLKEMVTLRTEADYYMAY